MATHEHLLLLSNLFNSRKLVILLQSINISTKKLVKKLFVVIDFLGNTKQIILDLHQILFS